jgi:hypothetical protein
VIIAQPVRMEFGVDSRCPRTSSAGARVRIFYPGISANELEGKILKKRSGEYFDVYVRAPEVL